MEKRKDLTQQCHTCQRTQSASVWFQLPLDTENLRCNQEICMDIMYIDLKALLHIVDIATKFSAPRFLPDSITTSEWSLFVK